MINKKLRRKVRKYKILKTLSWVSIVFFLVCGILTLIISKDPNGETAGIIFLFFLIAAGICVHIAFVFPERDEHKPLTKKEREYYGTDLPPGTRRRDLRYSNSIPSTAGVFGNY